MHAVTRIYQPGATRDSYNRATFQSAGASLQRMLDSALVQRIVVVINCDPRSPLSEPLDVDGIPATQHALVTAFAREMRRGRLVVHHQETWGANPGSARALTSGCGHAVADGADAVLVWSTELAVDPSHVQRALEHLRRNDLACVGFLRQRWQERLVWQLPQNTGVIYRSDLLEESGYFSPECDGDAGHTLELPEFGAVPLAGMEDAHLLLRRLKAAGGLRWGMVGRDEPLAWNTDFPPGSRRALDHAKKVARQESVLYQYIAEIFGAWTRAEQEVILMRLFDGAQLADKRLQEETARHCN